MWKREGWFVKVYDGGKRERERKEYTTKRKEASRVWDVALVKRDDKSRDVFQVRFFDRNASFLFLFFRLYRYRRRGIGARETLLEREIDANFKMQMWFFPKVTFRKEDSFEFCHFARCAARIYTFCLKGQVTLILIPEYREECIVAADETKVGKNAGQYSACHFFRSNLSKFRHLIFAKTKLLVRSNWIGTSLKCRERNYWNCESRAMYE